MEAKINELRQKLEKQCQLTKALQKEKQELGKYGGVLWWSISPMHLMYGTSKRPVCRILITTLQYLTLHKNSSQTINVPHKCTTSN